MRKKLNELNTGRVLGRSEMKKIMAGSGSGSCIDECHYIGTQCGSGNTCNRIIQCCIAQCMGTSC